jgi:serine/threonine-protein kinase
VLGTPAYLAPEQAAGEAIDGRTDVYSLGALAYFLLTGRPPFAGKTAVKLLAAHLHEVPEPPSRLRPDVPPGLEAVVLRCLAKKPEERFATVEDLDRALAAALPPEDRG